MSTPPKSTAPVLSALLTSPARASECGMKSPEKLAESAQIVFVGTVASFARL